MDTVLTLCVKKERRSIRRVSVLPSGEGTFFLPGFSGKAGQKHQRAAALWTPGAIGGKPPLPRPDRFSFYPPWDAHLSVARDQVGRDLYDPRRANYGARG